MSKQKITRAKIRANIKKANDKMKLLQDELLNLHRQDTLLCDNQQWYTEEERTLGRGKNKTTHLMGIVHWNEDFIDEDTGDIVTIERSQYVMKDGEWL